MTAHAATAFHARFRDKMMMKLNNLWNLHKTAKALEPPRPGGPRGQGCFSWVTAEGTGDSASATESSVPLHALASGVAREIIWKAPCESLAASVSPRPPHRITLRWKEAIELITTVDLISKQVKEPMSCQVVPRIDASFIRVCRAVLPSLVFTGVLILLGLVSHPCSQRVLAAP